MEHPVTTGQEESSLSLNPFLSYFPEPVFANSNKAPLHFLLSIPQKKKNALIVGFVATTA